MRVWVVLYIYIGGVANEKKKKKKSPNKPCERERLLFLDSESSILGQGVDLDHCTVNDPLQSQAMLLPPSPPTSSIVCV